MYTDNTLKYTTPGATKSLNRPSKLPCTTRSMTKAEKKKYNVKPN